jgi:hypothetical protein
MTRGEVGKLARERRGVVPVIGVVLEFDLEPMQWPLGSCERKKCARRRSASLLPTDWRSTFRRGLLANDTGKSGGI